jgi:hypothetical protein
MRGRRPPAVVTGFSPELIELVPSGGLERPVIVRETVGSGAQLVYYRGHFDVVPARAPRS